MNVLSFIYKLYRPKGKKAIKKEIKISKSNLIRIKTINCIQNFMKNVEISKLLHITPQRVNAIVQSYNKTGSLIGNKRGRKMKYSVELNLIKKILTKKRILERHCLIYKLN